MRVFPGGAFVAERTHNPLVAGSSPAGPTKRTRRSVGIFFASADSRPWPNNANYQQNASELFEGAPVRRVTGRSGRVRGARNDEPRLPSRPSYQPFVLRYPT